MIKRALIRHYIVNMLQDTVDVGRRVYVGRPNTPLYINSLPALNVHFGDETREINVGSDYFPREHRCTLDFVCTVVVNNQALDGVNPVMSQEGMDFADMLGDQVLNAFRDDWRLARRLPGFDANSNYQGLINGYRLTGVMTYDVESDTDLSVIGQSMRFELPYYESASLAYRLSQFKGFTGAITRVGATDETVDPILLEVMGVINE